MELSDAVVLVTGASSGIGEATARAAADAGSRVVLAARRGDRVRALADELAEARAVVCDVTDPTQVDGAVRTAVDSFGGIDVLINNAGQGLQAGIEEIDPADFRALLDLNVVAPLMTMQAVIPVMRRGGGGSVVNVGSGTTFANAPGTGAYVASKIALTRLSEIARVELADDAIAVSTVIPFLTSTEFMASIRAGREAAEAMTAGAEAHRPERVAAAILELVRTGAPQLDLVPEAYGGSLEAS